MLHFKTKTKKIIDLIKLILIIIFVILTNLLILKVRKENVYSGTTKINDFIPNLNYKIFSNQQSSNNSNENSNYNTISNDDNFKDNKSKRNVKHLEYSNGLLEIPKINLYQALPNKEDSTINNVNKNIYVVKESIFPSDGKNSHIILAAHAGFGKMAFFKHLPELKVNDTINFYYQNKKYVYKVTEFYEIEKTGIMTFKASSENDITLITCLQKTNKQIIYHGTLIFTSNIS